MKRLVLTILIILTVLSCTACDATPVAPREGLLHNFSTNEMSKTLQNYVLVNDGDRTASIKGDGNVGEKAASEYIKTLLSSYVGAENVSVKEFSVVDDTYQATLRSQNVVGKLRPRNAKGTVVIGATYDNDYASVTTTYRNYQVSYLEGTKTEGATKATGTATVLALAKYLSSDGVKNSLSVNVDFVFYGLGSFGTYGASEYLSSLSNVEANELLLAINVNDLGGAHLYEYFDEGETEHGKLIKSVAKESGFDGYITEAPPSEIDYGIGVGNLPYTPYALTSTAGAYYGRVPVFAVYSMSKSGVNLYPDKLSPDTFENMENNRSEYALQMAVTAELISKTLLSYGVSTVLTNSKAQGSNVGWLLIPLVAYIISLSLCLLAFFPIIICTRKIEKNLRARNNNRKNVKVAVFGMEYETPDDDSVYVDVKQSNAPDINPFDDFDGDKKE